MDAIEGISHEEVTGSHDYNDGYSAIEVKDLSRSITSGIATSNGTVLTPRQHAPVREQQRAPYRARVAGERAPLARRQIPHPQRLIATPRQHPPVREQQRAVDRARVTGDGRVRQRRAAFYSSRRVRAR